jgi:tripartite-type tricarboxylate transporter receptor subunit TctC
MKPCWHPAIIALAIAMGFSPSAFAQTWPDKPIRAFIPFGAGSATDVVPRALFEPLSQELGQSIIVENRGGAGGTLGMGPVIRAEPDGYTILANSSAHTVAPWIVPNFPFDLAKDLSGAVMIGQNANVLIVSPSKGWKTAQDLVAAAKALPDVPTSLQAGYPNSDLIIWYGVFMPSKTSRDVVEKFHTSATKVIATSAMQQKLKQLAVDPMPMTPAEMDKHVVAEIGANEKVIKAAGIK